MDLNKTFVQEFQEAANGNGSKNSRWAFLNKTRAAARKLSSSKVAKEFDNIVQEYGRPAVAVCLANTIMNSHARPGDYIYPIQLRLWAAKVFAIWTNRVHDVERIRICNGLNPRSMEKYAGAFINSTLKEESK